MTQSNEKANHDDHIEPISKLPSHLIVGILQHLPIGDLVRTSILSRKWRNLWASVPRLEFGFEFFWKHPHHDILHIVTELLLLHNGPVHEFTLYNPCIPLDHPIGIICLDKWILLLSRGGIKRLKLATSHREPYQMPLPSHLFSCQELAYLDLCNFKLSLPPNFCGFRSLTEIRLSFVRIESVALESLISSCRLLDVLALSFCSGFQSISVSAPSLKVLRIRDARDFKSICLQKARNLTDLTLVLSNPVENFEKGGTSNLIQGLLKLERLRLGEGYVKLLSAGTIPQMLPGLINSLKYLELNGVNFNVSGELLFIICLLQSSPNLVKLVIESRFIGTGPMPDHLKELEWNSCCLSQLKTVNIHVDTDYKNALEFTRFLLANSSSLEILTFRVGRGPKPPDTRQLLSLTRDLLKMERASRKAKVKFLYAGLIE